MDIDGILHGEIIWQGQLVIWPHEFPMRSQTRNSHQQLNRADQRNFVNTEINIKHC